MEMPIIKRYILTLIVFSFAFISIGSSAHAIDISCGSNITSNTTLDSDLLFCPFSGIEIGTNNITLDCQGHTITGNRTAEISGINITNKENITIKNCIIKNFDYGIYLESTRYNQLINNTVNTNRVGFQIVSSTNNTFLSNTVENSSWWGIHLYSSSNNSIINNTVNSSISFGILLEFSDSNILTNNVANNNGAGFTLAGGFATGSNNNILTNNTANNNHGGGFHLSVSSYNNLTNNTANNNQYGFSTVSFHDHNYNRLTFNTANNNTLAGFDLGSHSNTLVNNTANNNSISIRLYTGSYNTLINNTSNNNSIGIYLTVFSSYNTLTSNIVNNNGIGLLLNRSSNSNTINSTTIQDNIIVGINISGSTDNLLYNNFFNNNVNVRDDGNNFWNIIKTAGANIINGSFLGGNFWGDYNGNDTNDDGLGDTLLPYNSNGLITNGGDLLPLVNINRTPRSDGIVSIDYNSSIFLHNETFKVYLTLSQMATNITSVNITVDNQTIALSRISGNETDGIWYIRLAFSEIGNKSFYINYSSFSTSNYTFQIIATPPQIFNRFYPDYDTRNPDDIGMISIMERFVPFNSSNSTMLRAIVRNTNLIDKVWAIVDNGTYSDVVNFTYKYPYPYSNLYNDNDKISIGEYWGTHYPSSTLAKGTYNVTFYANDTYNNTDYRFIGSFKVIAHYVNITKDRCEWPRNTDRATLCELNMTGGTGMYILLGVSQDPEGQYVMTALYREDPTKANYSMSAISRFIEMEPSQGLFGTSLFRWAYIRIYYNISDLNGTDENDLGVYYYNETIKNWTLVESSGVNTTEHFVWFNVTHFSSYGVFVKPTCSDGIQNQGETGVDCDGPCSACYSPPPSIPSVGGGGSGAPSTKLEECKENWNCGEWSTCIGGKQTRMCIDLNKCNTTKNKPIEEQSCKIELPKEQKPPEENMTVPTEKKGPTIPTGLVILAPVNLAAIIGGVIVIGIIFVLYWKKLFIFKQKKIVN